MGFIKLGTQAPEFTLEDCYGELVSLASLRGKKVIFYFFTSPGGGNWTRMALGYREDVEKLRSKNIIVYGMNDKGHETAREWIERENLPFSILLDVDRKVGISFGISDEASDRYVANNADGRRPAVAVDEFGRIVAWEPDMNTVEQIHDLIERI